MLLVSLLAIVFDILPVLLSAALSALAWNFLFIPPVFTIHIASAEDGLLFLMYFVIALVNAVLTSRIRKIEKKASTEEEKERTIGLYNTLLNSLSHELRTPVAAIISAVDSLKEHHDKLSDGAKTDLLNEIDIASMRLTDQVENLLNMNRLQSGFLKLNADWCDVNELIFHVIQKLPAASTRQPVIFRPDEQLPLYKLDAGLFEQILLNLLANAFRYTSQDTTVSLEAYSSHGHLTVTVSDTGPGFPDETIPKVFDPFFRVPNSKTGGTGLGLSIVKGYVEAHGGKVRLENIKPHGARFTLEFACESLAVNRMQDE